MRNIYIKLISLSILIFSASSLFAQKECVIKGKFGNDSLRFSKAKVEQVYLVKIDEFDRHVNIDSAKVVDYQFEFKRSLKDNEDVLIYLIGGFDNGAVPFFVEEGEISIFINNAAYPGGAKISGTKTNDLYNEYNQIFAQCIQEQIDSLAILKKRNGEAWLDTKEGETERFRIGAAALLESNAKKVQFLAEHNDSPITPLMLEKEIYYNYDKKYAKTLASMVSPKLEKHPYNISFQNAVKALDIRVGGDVPDILLPLSNGEKKRLSDYRGKYVLLDFWASWCGPCVKEIPFLKQIYSEFVGKKDNFALISYSLDDKEKAWKDGMEKHNINLNGWIHASELLGWKSSAATLLGIKAVPQIILIDPQGKIISLTLRGEETYKRIKQVLSGDLYYTNSEKVAGTK